MAKPTEEELTKIKSHCANNSGEILRSKSCSCLFCRQTYEARRVSDWTDSDGAMSAICPECGMPYVVGDGSGMVFDKPTLRAINKALFGADYMTKHPEAAAVYVYRYAAGKISRNPTNEALYVNYLRSLKDREEPDIAARATYMLADFYDEKAEFAPLDHKAAFELFSAPPLAHNAQAFTRIGLSYLAGHPKGRRDARSAFIFFSKAAVDRDPLGTILYYDCFFDSIYVKQDKDYALTAYLQIFSRGIDRFACKEYCHVSLPLAAYRIAEHLLDNPDSADDRYYAFYFALFAAFAFEHVYPDEAHSDYVDDQARRNGNLIEAAAKKIHIHPRKPQLDQDTFTDSTMFAFSPFVDVQRFYLRGGPSTISEGEFDEQNRVFSFTMNYSEPPIIVDFKNGFIDKGPTRIRWHFRDVQDVRFDCDVPINALEATNDVIRFLYVDDGRETLVGSVLFMPAKRKKKHKKKRPLVKDGNQA